MKTIVYKIVICVAFSGSLCFGAAAPAFNMQALHTSLVDAEKKSMEISAHPTDNVVAVQTNALAEFAKQRHPLDLIFRWIPKDKNHPDGDLLVYIKKFAGYEFDDISRVAILREYAHDSRPKFSNQKGIRFRGKSRNLIGAKDCLSKWIHIAGRFENHPLSDDEA